jgi:hypothetical protein
VGIRVKADREERAVAGIVGQCAYLPHTHVHPSSFCFPVSKRRLRRGGGPPAVIIGSMAEPIVRLSAPSSVLLSSHESPRSWYERLVAWPDVFSLVLTLQTRQFMLDFKLEHHPVRHANTDTRLVALVAARYIIQLDACQLKHQYRITGPASHLANDELKLEYPMLH